MHWVPFCCGHSLLAGLGGRSHHVNKMCISQTHVWFSPARQSWKMWDWIFPVLPSWVLLKEFSLGFLWDWKIFIQHIVSISSKVGKHVPFTSHAYFWEFNFISSRKFYSFLRLVCTLFPMCQPKQSLNQKQEER